MVIVQFSHVEKLVYTLMEAGYLVSRNSFIFRQMAVVIGKPSLQEP